MAHLTPSIRQRFDRAGIMLAGLCALHCLATILLVSALGLGGLGGLASLGGQFLLSPEIHRIGLLLALIIAAVAIGWGALKHRRAAPFFTAMTGLGFMGGALAMPHGIGEAVLTLIGVALVTIGHLLNLRPFLKCTSPTYPS